jgi:hypothetical protein
VRIFEAFWGLSPPSPAFYKLPYIERGKPPLTYNRVCGNGTVFCGLGVTREE